MSCYDPAALNNVKFAGDIAAAAAFVTGVAGLAPVAATLGGVAAGLKLVSTGVPVFLPPCKPPPPPPPTPPPPLPPPPPPLPPLPPAPNVPAAFDPNDKLTLAGYGTSNDVPAGTLLPYRIDFENEPTATAP